METNLETEVKTEVINGADTEIKAEPKKPRSSWPLWIRILAIFLAVLMVAQLVLMNASNIKFSADDFEDQESSDIAKYLTGTDEYLTADRLQRMRAVMYTLKKPETFDEYSLFASVSIADGDYDNAIKYLDSCISLYEGNDTGLGNLYIKQGCLWALKGDWDKASDIIQKGIDLNPANDTGILMLAESYLRKGDYEKSIENMEKYAAVGTMEASQYMAVATMQFALERYEESVENCTKALESDGCDKAAVHYLRAQAYYMLGDYVKAVADAQASIDNGGDAGECLLLIAMCSESSDDYASALEAYLKMIKDGPQDQSIYEQAARCAYVIDDYESLEYISTEAIKQFTTDDESAAEFKQWLGIAQLELGKFAEAEENLTAVIEQSGGAEELYYLRGLCRLSTENYEGAEEDFTKSVMNEELMDESLYNRAICRIQLNDAEGAAEDLQTVLDRDCDKEVVSMTFELLGIDENEYRKAVAEENAAAEKSD